MAIIILGKTKCQICQNPLLEADEIVGFPPLFANRRSGFRLFHDAGFHRSCVESHPLGPRAIALLERFMQSTGPGRRLCAACGSQITDPEDHFGAGLLTEDPSSPLDEFNFVSLHQSHFPMWIRGPEFRRLVEANQISDAWDGPRIVFEPTLMWVPRS
jgi:hypothetical protein